MATVLQRTETLTPVPANDAGPVYRPSQDEPFMSLRQQSYFRDKLLCWKDAILRESQDTLSQLQIDSLREPDLTDRASSETDWSIELRTRDRQRKLISKIEAALRRDRGGRVRLLRSDGRAYQPAAPGGAADRDHDGGGAGAARAARAQLARGLTAATGGAVSVSLSLAPLCAGPARASGAAAGDGRRRAGFRQDGDTDVVAAHDRRRDSLFMTALLRVGAEADPVEVRVRNLSEGGLMIEFDRMIEPGAAVSLEMRGLGRVTGAVAWSTRGRVGIALDQPIDPKRARKPVGAAGKPRR